MSMISFESKGSFERTTLFLKRMMSEQTIFASLDKYGREGSQALENATPVDEGETASAWDYEIVRDNKSWSIIWSNTHVVDGRPVAILIQYGHGTRNGGYVQGRDYINPALQPIFDRIANDVWKVVTSA